MVCLECQKYFSTERSLHAHLKSHSMYLADYYTKHFPRKDLWTGQQIEFKCKDEYFSTYFTQRSHLLKWLDKKNSGQSLLMLDMLEKRVQDKELKFAPNEIELFFANLPPIDAYKKAFGSYSSATKSCGVKPMFSKQWSKRWAQDFSHKKIYVDSREQQPLKFKNQETLKLDIGDYAVSGEDFAYTFVDRKSFGDWASTLVGANFDRFKREVERCVSQNSFLWVVVETDLENIHQTNSACHHKHKLSYVAHQMRLLQHEFRGNLQFYFSGGRKQSQDIIPKLLCIGKEIWLADAQYWIQKQEKHI